MMLNTPVVFMIFNRPDLTKRVFQTIRQAQPKKLLVVADGPRINSPDETKKCELARAVIDQVDWNCEVLRNYSGTNLGCRKRVSSGLDWVFSQVNEAIILEDDCLPHPSFFSYCEILLHHYRDDERVMVVSGDNFQNGHQRTPYSYYFSKYNHCWGWATWKRAWNYWSLDSNKWIDFRNEGLIASVCSDPLEQKYWTDIFDDLFINGKPDSWAYAWTFACWAQGGLTALPNLNLVSNIGFGTDATHTVSANSPFSEMSTQRIVVETHPPCVISHYQADKFTFYSHFGGAQIKHNQRLLTKIRNRLKGLNLF